jgi:hypothetical protein
MGSPYNTRMREQIVYLQKENRQRELEAKTYKSSSQRLQRPFSFITHLLFTTMAPPKQVEARETARKTIVQTKSRVQVEEGEQQLPKIVNVDEILSPDMIPINSTHILEEIPHPSPEGTNIDRPVEIQEPQNHDKKTLKEVQPENTEAAPRVNETTSNMESSVDPNEFQTTISDHP